MSIGHNVVVFGPAYLDRVVRLDRPILPESAARTIDASTDGFWDSDAPGTGLRVVDPTGSALTLRLPPGWPGPTGTVRIPAAFGPGFPVEGRDVGVFGFQDDLGGMGAGYAKALGGRLVSALGSRDDPTTRRIERLLSEEGIEHAPVEVSGVASDWTLLLTSGEHGDKLPIGFRGCHSSITEIGHDIDAPCDLRVVASFPNRLASTALAVPGARIRCFAPAMRNVSDRTCPIKSFAGAIDVLSCNRREWESLEDREEVRWRLSILIVTDGPDGARIFFTRPDGDAGHVRIPAFPRRKPPRDTNRAGEAFASEFLKCLIRHDWTPGPTPLELVASAAERASAAAALVLDRTDFGFPSDAQVDRAIALGEVVEIDDRGIDKAEATAPGANLPVRDRV